ncbi:SICA antigen [Plasmodium coatneyi]|uniref:SICA antigen n=1 Tax=Plasmodium coatneyi TaxID=208452 RepID=A0A1B1E020_9APIC|nr:SICA antigen [Plasmodium coatneyi]ANQ08197.1 SICA antigen [Plasmodium coatneyi]
MKTLIDRMSKEMMKKGDMGIARAGCHDMIKQGVVMTHEEEEECAYILSNLWEIGTVSRVQCGRGMIDEDIKDYVRCAVMNMWSFLYHSAHCEAGRAIKAAFGAIKSMGEALSTGIKCTECEYGMLEPMVISGKRTLNYIRGAMEQNTELMKLIKGGPKPNKPCPQQPNTAPSALGPPNVATTGHEYKQTGPIVTKSATNKTKPYEFLTKLLHLWIMARGTSQLDEFETLIWDDLWKVFDDMMNNVLEDANDEKTLCAREDGNRKQILHGDNQGKELCKMLIKISLWIDGWNQKFDRINRWHWVPREREKKAKERRLQNYLRCLIGKVTMLGMFKTHCKLNKVTPVVKISMENKRKEGNVKNRSGICDEIDNASIGVGGKLIWEELENWINGYTRQANEGKGFREVVAGQSPLHTIKGEGKNGCPTGKEKEGNREETLSDLGIVVIPGEEKENKEEDNVNWKKSAIGDMLKKLKQKEDERRRASGCSPSNTNGFEEGEEDSIMEWFTKFFNNPAEDDEQYEPGKYDWSKYDKYSAICEEGADDPRFDAKKYGYFCKIMLKNLMMVTNQGNQNKPENSNTKCKRKFIPICDLLKIWMTYMGESCVPRSVMQYVFEAVENLEKEWKGEKNYEKCEYGNISNLYRGNTDIGHEVSKLLRNSTVGSKLGELNRRNWCDESRRRYWTHPDMYNKVSRSDEGTDGGRSQIEGVMKELKSLVKGVDEGIEEEEKELGDIMGTVTEVVNEVMQQQQQQQLPPPSTSAAGQVVECTDKTDLCVRADCVAERWRANREVNNVTFPDWLGTFWNNDVNSRLKKLSDAMTTDDKNNEEECESITVSGNASLEANKKACNYIVKGLKHIYNIQKDPVKITQGKNLQVEERKASDNQLFWRTMECVLLNAYADKLEQQSPCTPKAGVTHAFTAGKQLWNDICNNKGDTNCVQCTREPNFKNCEINDSKKSKKDKVEGRVNKLLNGTNGTQLQTTLAAINSLNNNTLCQRVQCVTVKWFEDRIYSETSKQNWCTFWGANDVGKVLREMSKAMTKEDGTDDHLCKNFTRTNGEAIPTEPDKKACQYITKGLRYIYNIQENPKDDYKNQKKNNRIFYQTVGCLFLNAYADRIITTCPDVDEDKIVSMFKSGNNNKDTWCKDKVNGNDCVQCERDTNYKSCTLSVKEALLNKKPGKECEHHKDNIKKKLDDMLNPNENGDQVVKPALTEINNICETVAAKPAGTTKPATTKPGKDQKPEAVENVQTVILILQIHIPLVQVLQQMLNNLSHLILQVRVHNPQHLMPPPLFQELQMKYTRQPPLLLLLLLILVVHLMVIVRNKILNQRPLLNQMLYPRNQNYLLYQEGKVQLYMHQQKK